jgi:CheY-like chemotaxis protein
MGGAIGLDSQPGNGSLFWFTVKLRRAPLCALPLQPPPYLTGKRVLVVDDNATNREILTWQITDWGMAVQAVADGHAALDLLHRARNAGEAFDLAILDMQMPEMDGLKLAQLIQADPALTALPLIMLTSTGQHVAGTDTHTHFQRILSKPIRQSDLYEAVTACFTAGVEAATTRPSSVKAQKYELPGRPSVLLAEDNVVNQQVALAMLEDMGCEVSLAADGIVALQKLSQHRFDIVLMDCQMPGMDGYGAARAWRQQEAHEGRARTIIVALTANAMQGDRERCLEAGMDDYLTKPVRQEQLFHMLERWLLEAPASAQDAERSAPISPVKTESETLPVLDVGALESIRALDTQGNGELLTRVLGLYLEESAKSLAVIQQAAANQDWQAVRQAAHSLKSSSANVGAVRLAALFRQIEADSRAANSGAVVDQLTEAGHQHVLACQALRDYKIGISL